jgi:hypothetical protein
MFKKNNSFVEDTDSDLVLVGEACDIALGFMRLAFFGSFAFELLASLF